MINKVLNYTLKANIVKDLEKVKDIEGYDNKIFNLGFLYFLKNFEFEFTEKQVSTDQMNLIKVKNNTDWLFDDQNRSVNCFFSLTPANNITLQVMFCDKYFDVSIDNKHVYFLPSWMSYRFISNEDEKNILNFWYYSKNKIIKKENNIVW